jgi:hypothetical protein
MDRADKLKKRIGGETGGFDGDEFPPKPSRMHWTTYRRLEERYDELQNTWAVGVMRSIGFCD